MDKIRKTLKTLRGKLAILAVIISVVFTVDVMNDMELPTKQRIYAVAAVLVICLTAAVIMWITGWKYANQSLADIWAKWDGKHELPNQQKRMRKAIQPLFDSYKFDRDTGDSKFRDVGGSGSHHQASLIHCTCSDYQKRHLPCCHMYYIAGELGLIDLYQAVPKKETTEETAVEESAVGTDGN